MATFLYRCPTTGLRVQGWVADDPTERNDDSYEAVTCPVCMRVHTVGPKTGKLLGEDDDRPPGDPLDKPRHRRSPSQTS